MLIDFSYLFREYQIKSTGVLHLGAHWGEEAQAYENRGIKEVIWVEALPHAFRRLQKEMASMPKLKSTCLQACLSDEDGKEVTFNIASNMGQSSSFLEFGTHSVEHPSVKYIDRMKMITSRLDTLLLCNRLSVGPGWFLNIDLQGCELLALKGMGPLLWKFDHAYIEVNRKELYKGCPMVEDVDAYLAQFGFVGKETKWTGAGWGDKYYQRDHLQVPQTTGQLC